MSMTDISVGLKNYIKNLNNHINNLPEYEKNKYEEESRKRYEEDVDKRIEKIRKDCLDCIDNALFDIGTDEDEFTPINIIKKIINNRITSLRSERNCCCSDGEMKCLSNEIFQYDDIKKKLEELNF